VSESALAGGKDISWRMAREDMKDLVIAGAMNPGSVKLVHEINDREKEWNLIGFVDDDPRKLGTEFCGYPVLGSIASLQRPEFRAVYAVCCIFGGSILTRVKVVRRMVDAGVQFATLVHPSVSTRHTDIGRDCMINDGCILNYGVRIGDHCILNFRVSVGHDTTLEDLVFVAPGVTIPGRVRVKQAATLGAGAVLNGDITIGEYAMVGLGAVVFRDVPDRATVIGNPARMVVQDSTESRHPL
jgi:sugar O-acyltransferase (sialic acid O-acetyltransferase NeuD family)